MKISIIVPVYNVEKYLSRCLNSILNQTYSHLEIIIVNDGSTDNSLNICNEFAEKDKRIVLINQRNKGLSGARNTGLRFASGDYVGFIDSDDMIESDMIEDCYKIIESYSPDVITTNVLSYKRGNASYTEFRNNLPYGKILNKKEIIKHFIEPYYGGYMGIIPSVWSKLYKLAFLKRNNHFFDETLKRSEDYWFNFFVFITAEDVYAINKGYYHYYANEGSMIRSFRENQFEAFLSNRNRLLAENEVLKCNVNWIGFNNNFTNSINELIILAINTKGILQSYAFFKNIIKNDEFKKILLDTNSVKLHVQLIQWLIIKKSFFFTFCIYYFWSFKAKFFNAFMNSYMS